MSVDSCGLEVLGRDECLALLRPGGVGRVGVTCGALPMIFPVTYGFDAGHVVLRMGMGTTLESAVSERVVAFETDNFEMTTGDGWSVLVTGLARPVSDPAEVQRLQSLGLPSWAAGEERFLRLSIEILSGRRSRTG